MGMQKLLTRNIFVLTTLLCLASLLAVRVTHQRQTQHVQAKTPAPAPLETLKIKNNQLSAAQEKSKLLKDVLALEPSYAGSKESAADALLQ